MFVLRVALLVSVVVCVIGLPQGNVRDDEPEVVPADEVPEVPVVPEASEEPVEPEVPSGQGNNLNLKTKW